MTCVRALLALVCIAAALAGCGRADSAQAPATPPTQLDTAAVPAEMPTALPATALQPTPAGPVSTVALDMGVSNLPVVVTPVVTRTIALRLGAATLQVELASTPQQRQYGLMGRTSMPSDYGMLFVFPTDQALSFWMRDTPLPLSIAFIDAQQRILNIEDMQPFDDQTFHLSRGAARYALEVNQGWFAEHGVKAGDLASFTLPGDLEIR